MSSNYETERQWADKVAFLGIFIVALLIAQFIVVSRSSIVLSEPIELGYGGLSVSIPLGNGWQGVKQWKYHQDAFTLGSFLSVSAESVDTLVSCRYQLAPVKATPRILLEEKAFAAGGVIKDTGRVDLKRATSSGDGDVLAIDWAHIKNKGTLCDTFYGIVQLPSNHRLDIEVYQAAGDTQLAEELFESVAESLEFKDNKSLEDGGKVLEEIKSKGLNGFLGPRFSEDSPSENRNRESFFLIKEAGGRLIGFSMEVLDSRFVPANRMPQVDKERPENESSSAVVEPESQLGILAGSFYYIRHSAYNHRQTALFQSDDDFSEFLWKSETYDPTGRSGVEMVLGKDGILAVRKFDGRLEEKDCQVSSIAVPDILSELIFSQMFESNHEEIFMDIIAADSRIIPTSISRVEQSGQAAARRRSEGVDFFGEEAACVFQLRFLDDSGFSEKVYLDDEGQIFGRLLQQEKKYVLERTDEENILRQFPEHGRYILQRKEEVFEQDQLMENGE